MALMSTDDLKVYARYSQFGFEMVAPILLGLGVDYLFNTGPWGVVVGAVLSLVYMVVRLQRLMQTEDAKPNSERPPS